MVGGPSITSIAFGGRACWSVLDWWNAKLLASDLLKGLFRNAVCKYAAKALVSVSIAGADNFSTGGFGFVGTDNSVQRCGCIDDASKVVFDAFGGFDVSLHDVSECPAANSEEGVFDVCGCTVGQNGKCEGNSNHLNSSFCNQSEVDTMRVGRLLSSCGACDV